MATVYAVVNQKGGVGKTTTVVNLGSCLAELGWRVLVVDIDPQANATSALGVEWRGKSVYEVLMEDEQAAAAVIKTDHPWLDLVPSGISLAGAEVELVGMAERESVLRRRLVPLQPNYDYLLVDCPPSLGLLAVNGLTAADAALIPVQCEYLALEGLGRLLQTIDLVRENLNPSLRVLGVVMTMFDSRTNLSQQVVREVQRHLPELVFRTVVPRTVRLAEAASYGQSILEYDPTSRGAEAYRALAQEVLERQRAYCLSRR